MANARESLAVRNNIGLWATDTDTVLRFGGADAAIWLHAQTTNHVASLETGQGSQNALLDRTGRLLAVFTVHRWNDELWVIVPRADKAAIEARIDSHLFLEDVQMEDVGSDSRHIHLEGPRTLIFLDAIMGGGKLSQLAALPVEPNAVAPVKILGFEVLAFRQTVSGEDGFRFVTGPGEDARFLQALQDHAAEFMAVDVSPASAETLRIEAGQPRFGVDITTHHVINETPLEETAVAYDKGCYLGQEVVARLKTYGSPKTALVGLVCSDPGAQLPAVGTALHVGTARVGEMRSSTYSPTLQAWIGLASLDREHRVPGARHTFRVEGGSDFETEVRALPLVAGKTRTDFATTLYHDALEHFEGDANDEDDTAITLLKQAILLAPTFEDAYEALGVILHRHHRVDEAIQVMKFLAKLNPNCVMAHTNLSVFYVAKGMITEAEHEKALAQQLEFKLELDARAAEKVAEAERARIRHEAEERIGMFREVLEFDPEDPIATMGLGSAYIQLEAYADAIPHLETATRVKKDYSAAFLNLGKCHEFLGDRAAAIAAYHAGIEAASRKGDLMPLREMERRLRALEPTGA